MDIDHLEQLATYDIEYSKFSDDLINILSNTFRYYGYQYANL